MTFNLNAGIVFIVGMATLGMPADARAEAPDEPGATIQLNGVRDPALMPYQKAYELLSTVASAGSNRVQLAVRVVSKKSEMPIPDLEIGLRGEHTFEALRVTPSGFVDIPVSEAALADRADFVTNQKKGTLQLDYYFVPKLPERGLKYGDLIQSIEGARRVQSAMTPWYLRILTTPIKDIGICYPDNRQTVSISNSRDTARPAQIERVSTLTKQKVHCAEFSAKESRIPDNAYISAPAGWHLMYR